ncbi:hypothetical protein FGO68_gene8343 [Halteria grandinella]|uniref:Uncharacterized protein n=1 Tax=Halteria grandinella TaxID=5974 RepID=A0A8J8NTL6_HALGN|nr:hypothetical protein FGO68_gene8343 [Halteria grandinella]
MSLLIESVSPSKRTILKKKESFLSKVAPVGISCGCQFAVGLKISFIPLIESSSLHLSFNKSFEARSNSTQNNRDKRKCLQNLTSQGKLLAL